MSCPDWPAATAWRRGDGAAPAEWSAQLAHLAGCAGCRRRVAVLDPTLLLVAAAAPAPRIGDAEARALAGTVRSLIRAGRLEGRGRSGRHALVAAVAVAALLAVPLGLSRLSLRTAPPVVPRAATLLEPVDEPPVEEVQPAGARVYQLGSEELQVVLIVDENLDL